MSDLEQLKAQAEQARIAKKNKSKANDKNQLEPTDVFMILHKDEMQTLEDVILDVLAGEPISLSREQKQHLITFIKHIQED